VKTTNCLLCLLIIATVLNPWIIIRRTEAKARADAAIVAETAVQHEKWRLKYEAMRTEVYQTAKKWTEDLRKIEDRYDHPAPIVELKRSAEDIRADLQLWFNLSNVERDLAKDEAVILAENAEAAAKHAKAANP
jgi:hypothetical protein